MTNIQIIQGDFEQKLKLQFAPGIKAEFPSPAEDYSHETLDSSYAIQKLHSMGKWKAIR